MNFFIDFEATQPEQEIISIGAIADNGATFHSLVRPQFSTISKYISDMTGITQEDVTKAYDLNIVMADFYAFCYNQEPNLTKWKFYSYGDSDIDFLKHSICNIFGENPLIITSLMIATMKDYSKDVKKYFHGGTSLIKAYNYLKDLENKQNHNALEDAKMLSEVFMRIKDQEPLAANPFVEQTITSYNFPTGRFFCKSVGKNAKEREFDCIQDAIEWLIETNICKDSRDAVRRDKMAAKIMKAIRKKDRYMNYKWRRIK